MKLNMPTDEKLRKPSMASKSEVLTRNFAERYSTAFAIATNEKNLRLLTCTHSVEEIYKAGVHDVSPATVNTFYRFDVLCMHQESGFVNQPDESDTAYSVAFVAAIDTKKDLMILELPLDKIFLGRDHNGQNIVCSQVHRTLDMAESGSGTFDKVFLQGWPPLCSKALSCGQMCVEGRPYSSISMNPKGYTMNLSDTVGMLGAPGYSGGPVVNHKQQCSGVFHGCIYSRGYAVTISEVKDFLNSNQMLTDWSGSYDDIHEDEEGYNWHSEKKKRKVTID